MSIPQNPNARYRTYSYHHILLVAQTTDILENLPTDLRAFGRGVTSDSLVDSGGYFVLINGATDVHFVMTDVWWRTIFAGIPDSSEHPAIAQGIEGELIIDEPGGIDFLNVLNAIGNFYGTIAAQLAYAVKTFFVGHTHDGTVEINSYIKPFIFMGTKLNATIRSSETRYSMRMVGTTNGAASLPGVGDASIGQAVQVDPGSTLAQVLTKVEDVLNTNDDRKYDHFENKQREADPDNSEESNIVTGSRIKFVFKIDEKLGNLKAGENELVQFTNSAKNDPLIAAGKESIRRWLEKIMMSSKEVVKLVEETGTAQSVFKITDTFRITDSGPVVTFSITSYENPVNPNQVNGAQFQPPSGQLLTLEYLFTGKNTDIQSFDLELTLANTLYSKILVESPNRNQNEYGQSASPTANYAEGNSSQKTPLQLGAQLPNSFQTVPRHESANQADMGATGAFYSQLNLALQRSMMRIKLNIIGNPTLLSEQIFLPSESSRITETDQVEGREGGDNFTVAPNLLRRPGYVKLIVKYPAKNNDTSDLKLIYDGAYTIISVINKFQGGLFTQELDLAGIKTKDPIQRQTSVSDQIKQNINPPGFRGGAITTAQAAPGRFKAKKGPDGKYNFSPEVNEAISKASKKHGVDESFMRNMCYIESKGDPNAVSPTGAKGLFQFVGGTANQYGIRGKEFDIDANADAAARFAKDNQRALENDGIDPIPENLYIAHQQGAGGANTLHRAANQGLEYNQLSPGLRENMRLNNSAGLSAQGYINKWNNKYGEVDSRVADAGTPSTTAPGIAPSEVDRSKQVAANTPKNVNTIGGTSIRDRMQRYTATQQVALREE